MTQPDRELFIVEGESAESALAAVCSPNQRVFSVQGKIPNALREPRDRFRSHATTNELIELLDAGDPARVILCTDGDPDGVHIQVLLMMLFLRHLTEWIDTGRLFTIRPPMFRFEHDSRGPMYAYTPDQRSVMLERYRAAGSPNPKVFQFRGLGMLDRHELRRFCTDPDQRALRPVTIESAEAAAATFGRYLAP